MLECPRVVNEKVFMEDSSFQRPAPKRTWLQSCLPGCLISAVFFLLCLIGGCAGVVFLVSRCPGYLEGRIPGDKTKNHIACITVKGPITLSGENLWYAAPNSAPAALAAIEEAIADASVKAIFLTVDSPGGGITDSDILYNALQRFKKSSPDRRILTLFGDMAASGGYYISLPSDLIMAHPTTLTGSIGVIMQSFNLQELVKMLGVAPVTIKSGENKDILSPFREMTPEQHALLQNIIDALQTRFVALTAENRRLPEEKVRQLADGRIYLAAEAMNEGLIDAIGYEADAKDKLRALINDQGAVFYTPASPAGFFSHLFNPGFSLNLKLPQLTGEATGPHLKYQRGW